MPRTRGDGPVWAKPQKARKPSKRPLVLAPPAPKLAALGPLDRPDRRIAPRDVVVRPSKRQIVLDAPGVGRGRKPLARVQGVDAPAVARGIGRFLGGAAHGAYPRGGRGAGSGVAVSRAGSLPGRKGYLVNSAPGIVLRSTVVSATKQPGRTAGDTAKSVLMIPAGLARLALHPAQGVKAIEADYVHRYRAAVRGDYRAFHARQMREGAAPEVFDIAGVAAGGGTVSGRLLQKAAVAGKLGSRAQMLATVVKPLRVSGGAGGVVPREASRNFYKNVARSAVDRRRGVVQARRVRGGQASGLAVEAAARGEVTPLRAGAAARAQRRMVARRGGEALAAMKAEQAREVLGRHGVAGTVRGLNKHERAGLKYAAVYGVRTPEQARVVLARLEQRIVAERAKAVAEGHPMRLVNDELPVIRALREQADAAFTPRLRAAVKVEGNRNRRLAARDPALVQQQALRRTYMPAADLLGVAAREGESAVVFARRVRQEMARHGLGSATYFKSEELPKALHAMFAKGGRRAVAGERAYTGALTRTGRESGSPEIMVRSAAQSIKRRVNWNLVADTVDEHAFAWSKERKFTAHDLQREVRVRGIDPASVRLWNPRLFRKEREAAGLTDVSADPTHVEQRTAEALRRAGGDLHSPSIHPSDFKQSGWQLVPAAAFDEVMGAVGSGGEGKVARAFDISKGKVSRALLANPGWAAFQVGANTFGAGLAGMTPFDFVRGNIFFRRTIAPAQREAVQAVFGVHGWYDQQRHLGATADSRFVNAYRAMKDTEFYRRAHHMNPLDVLFFRPDNAQNNAFRMGVMYSRLKREAYAQMGKDASAMVRAQNRIIGILAKGPREERMLEIVKNRPLLEKHAKAVDDFLGNWTTYTARERHGASRYVMFYGFVRFSVRLAFYTMPVGHPVMLSILAQVGRLEKDELRRIFGVEPPPWEYGNFYAPQVGPGRVPTGSASPRIPLVRLVPFFNALQYGGDPASAVGMLTPFVGIAANQVAGRNLVLDKPYTVRGSTAYVQHRKDLSSGDKARIAIAELLNLSPYVRAANAAVLRGKQGSDSSLLFPRPVRYSKADAVARNRALIAAQERRGVLGAVRETLLPQFGTDADRIIANARSFGAAKTKAPKVPSRRSSNPYAGVGGSAANPYAGVGR